jgi:hypothetical protein
MEVMVGGRDLDWPLMAGDAQATRTRQSSVGIRRRVTLNEIRTDLSSNLALHSKSHHGRQRGMGQSTPRPSNILLAQILRPSAQIKEPSGIVHKHSA